MPEFTKDDARHVEACAVAVQANISALLKVSQPQHDDPEKVGGLIFAFKMEALARQSAIVMMQEANELSKAAGHDPDCQCKGRNLQFWLDHLSNRVTSIIQKSLDDELEDQLMAELMPKVH